MNFGLEMAARVVVQNILLLRLKKFIITQAFQINAFNTFIRQVGLVSLIIAIIFFV